MKRKAYTRRQLMDFVQDLMHELGEHGIVPSTPKPDRPESELMARLRAQPGWEEMLADEREREGILRWIIEGAVLAHGRKPRAKELGWDLPPGTEAE